MGSSYSYLEYSRKCLVVVLGPNILFGRALQFIHAIEKNFTVRVCGLDTMLCMGVTKINETQTQSSRNSACWWRQQITCDGFECASDYNEI